MGLQTALLGHLHMEESEEDTLLANTSLLPLISHSFPSRKTQTSTS